MELVSENLGADRGVVGQHRVRILVRRRAQHQQPLVRIPGAEDEMVEMLRLAMDCTEPAPDQRPAMPEIVARIEGLGGTASTSTATARSGRSASVDEADDRPLRTTGSIRQS